jgi:DNA-binding beta-propeller fold protein YncE
MTASPSVAQPVPGTAPAPEAALEEVPGGTGPVDGTAEEPPDRRRRKLLILLLLLFGFALLLGLAIWYLLFRQPIPIPTIPGEVVMPTYSTAIYGTDRPMGVAVTPDGSRIFVGATEGDRIARIFDPAGNELGSLQPPLSTGAEHVPVYLAADPVNGEIYVTDRPTGNIYIYDQAGTYQRTFNPGTEFDGWQPLGIAFDTAGNLYVSDVSITPQRILMFDRAGAVVRTIGTAAELNFPNGIAVDKDGNVYVTDGNNGRLLVIDQNDAVVAQVGRGVGEGNLGLPRGMTIDGEGRVYVADATGQGVFVYGTWVPGERSLAFLGSFGGEGVGNGAFLYPNGITVDGRGRVYVTDAGNDRVQIWSY